MIYALTQLLDWSRRTGSDRLIRNRDSLVTDGTDQLVLTNDGNINIVSLTLAGVTQQPFTDYTQDVNVITFTVTPPAGTSAICVYERSQFTDVEILDYITDGTKNTIADLSLKGWQINTDDDTNPIVGFPDMPPVCNPTVLDYVPPLVDWMDPEIERLIVLRSGLLMREELANQNADDAILIKDGDTTIDTSKTAASGEKALVRIRADIQQAWRLAVANRAHGVALQNNWVPLPYPWSTPNMMPGEVNGPSY